MAGVEAAQVLHIGDDPLADVIGATRAGMQAVWLNRDGREWPQCIRRATAHRCDARGNYVSTNEMHDTLGSLRPRLLIMKCL